MSTSKFSSPSGKGSKRGPWRRAAGGTNEVTHDTTPINKTNNNNNNQFQLQPETAQALEQYLLTGGGPIASMMPASQAAFNMASLYDVTNNFCYGMGAPPMDQSIMSPLMNPQPNSDVYWHYNPSAEIYSRKVFVGGLPIDIDEDDILAVFSSFGPLVVDWPRKNENGLFHPPKGYVFLIYEHEPSVQALVHHCYKEKDDKYYICITSPTMKEKPCQVRPWRLADGDFVVGAELPLDPRKTVFIGGVPRPLKAVELASVMDRLYGGVCYAGIDSDPELKYPKGAGRVSFSSQQSFVAAITGRFVQLQHIEMDKRVEVRPYVLDDQMCDECQGQRCGGKYAPYFCAHVSCLQYYCDACWPIIHCRQDRKEHRALVKMTSNDSPQSSPTSRPPAQATRRINKQ